MSQVQHAVDVDVPVPTAYDQWTQFESFPNFMDGIDDHQVKADTKRFKEFVERCGSETGAWRGNVEDPS